MLIFSRINKESIKTIFVNKKHLLLDVNLKAAFIFSFGIAMGKYFSYYVLRETFSKSNDIFNALFNYLFLSKLYPNCLVHHIKSFPLNVNPDIENALSI